MTGCSRSCKRRPQRLACPFCSDIFAFVCPVFGPCPFGSKLIPDASSSVRSPFVPPSCGVVWSYHHHQSFSVSSTILGVHGTVRRRNTFRDNSCHKSRGSERRPSPKKQVPRPLVILERRPSAKANTRASTPTLTHRVTLGIQATPCKSVPTARSRLCSKALKICSKASPRKVSSTNRWSSIAATQKVFSFSLS